MTPFLSILKRDVKSCWRSGTGGFFAVVFFIMAASLFPLGVEPSPDTLALIAPGVLWITALLSCLLTLENTWTLDADDGSLDQFILARNILPEITAGILPEITAGILPEIMAGKMVAHWIVSGLALTLATPIVALLLNMPPHAILVACITLTLGTLFMSFTGGLIMCLLSGARRGAGALAIILIPLLIPALVFGASQTTLTAQGVDGYQSLSLLTALTLFSLSVCPFGAALIVRLCFRV